MLLPLVFDEFGKIFFVHDRFLTVSTLNTDSHEFVTQTINLRCVSSRLVRRGGVSRSAETRFRSRVAEAAPLGGAWSMVKIVSSKYSLKVHAYVSPTQVFLSPQLAVWSDRKQASPWSAVTCHRTPKRRAPRRVRLWSVSGIDQVIQNRLRNRRGQFAAHGRGVWSGIQNRVHRRHVNKLNFNHAGAAVAAGGVPQCPIGR